MHWKGFFKICLYDHSQERFNELPIVRSSFPAASALGFYTGLKGYLRASKPLLQVMVGSANNPWCVAWTSASPLLTNYKMRGDDSIEDWFSSVAVWPAEFHSHLPERAWASEGFDQSRRQDVCNAMRLGILVPAVHRDVRPGTHGSQLLLQCHYPEPDISRGQEKNNHQ